MRGSRAWSRCSGTVRSLSIGTPSKDAIVPEHLVYGTGPDVTSVHLSPRGATTATAAALGDSDGPASTVAMSATDTRCITCI